MDNSANNLSRLLDDSNVRCHLPAASRKRALQLIAELLADEELTVDTLFDGLMGRERLGSTGLGDGVAIPHCRVPTSQMRAAFISLKEPVDFEASDAQPVDLLFVLVVPEEEQQAHLQALAALAGVFSQPGNRNALRACESDRALRQTLCEQLAEQAPNARTA